MGLPTTALAPFSSSLTINTQNHLSSSGETTSAAKATSSTDTLLEFLDLDNLGRADALQDKLGNAIALLDLKVGLGMVKQENLDLAAVVGVNDTSAGVDKVLRSEARSGSNAAVLK